MYERSFVATIRARIQEPRRFMQIVIGPRQVGKTTSVVQALRGQGLPYCFARADAAQPPTQAWLAAEWAAARSLIGQGSPSAILVIDEVQKVSGWSSVVKALWDEDAFDGRDLRVVLCGSSALLLAKGLSESLMGRFELIRMPHWSFAECREAFGLTLDEFLLYGGYPGALGLRDDEARWLTYMRDSIIASTLSNDVLMLENVAKPAVLSALFMLGSACSGQEVSYRKLMGQLDDAGNAATIAHYLDLLGRARMLAAIPKFGEREFAVRNSTPRLMVYDTSLITATSAVGRDGLLADHARRGHVVESAVGAYLLGRQAQGDFDVYWWREGGVECDFVLRGAGTLTAVEVKSGGNTNVAGTAAFLARHPGARRVIVGPSEESIERFLCGEVL